MFRRSIPILLTPIFLDLIVTERLICLTNYVEISAKDYLRMSSDQWTRQPTFRFDSAFTPGQLPPLAEGIYYNRLPSARIDGVVMKGEEVASGLEGLHFRLRSYSILDLDDPTIRSGEKSDVAVWVCGIGANGRLCQFYNTIAHETGTKMHPMRSLRSIGAAPALFVYQPFADVPFTQCSLTLVCNAALKFRSNVTGWTEQTAPEDFDLIPHMDEALPKIALVSGGGTIAAGQTQMVSVELQGEAGTKIARDTTLYLEATGGYLPKQRTAMSDGEGSFPVMALGLASGDAFKVKVGFRNFSGVLDVPFTVV